MRNKSKLFYNTLTSLILEITNVICGFILPRLILSHYGTEVNGLVSSINQFLTVITLLDCGVGAVVISTLYQPIAVMDINKISQIFSSANHFFKRIAYFLLVYIIVLLVIFPIISHSTFDCIYIDTLLLAMGINSFFMYYLGIVDRLFLTASQNGFIQYTAQIITIIINTVVCYILISCNCSIQVVKFTTAIIYLARPLIYRIYINKHYNIIRNFQYDKDPIEQKKNGFAQHIAAYVLNGTDVLVLTIFSSLENVSVYTIYALVVNGIKAFYSAVTAGVESYLANIWNTKEKKCFNELFQYFEWIFHNFANLLFSCTLILIIPFVKIFTNGINDYNYIYPLFSIILTLAYYLIAIRSSYSILIYIVGHYKQTQWNYILVAVINLVISIGTVCIYGLIGVAIGTFIALFIQVFWQIQYVYKNILFTKKTNTVKLIFLDILIISVSLVFSYNFEIRISNYFSFLLYAALIFIIIIFCISLLNLLFFKNFTKKMLCNILRKIWRKKCMPN